MPNNNQTRHKMDKHKLMIVWLLLAFNYTAHSQTFIDTASFNPIIKELNFDNDNLVLIGEAHEVQNTFSTELFIIKNLATKGYKTIIIEGGESEAAIINLFLQTGDTTHPKHTRAGFNSSYNKFLQSIYQLNKEKGFELTFKGFDFERPKCLHYLFTKWFGNLKIEDGNFKKTIDYLLTIDDKKNYESSYTKTFFKGIKTSFSQYEDQYKEILNNNYNIFKKIVFNPVYFDSNRDKRIKESLLTLEKEEGLNKSILIAGSDHLLQKNTFTPLLLNDLSEKYSIISFIFIYSNCKSTINNRKYNSDKIILKCLNKIEDNKPLINFTSTEKKIIPTGRKNISNIIVGLYNLNL